jgi:hypothetical protein
VLFSVVANVDDHSGLNDHVWFMTKEDLEELEEELEELAEAEADEEPEIEIGLVGAPKLWVTSQDLMCIAILVRTSSNDPTKYLASPGIRLVTDDAEPQPLDGILPRWWSVTPTERGGTPATKTFDCFEVRREICPRLDGGAASASLRIEIDAGKGEEIVDLPLAGIADELQRICAAS